MTKGHLKETLVRDLYFLLLLSIGRKGLGFVDLKWLCDEDLQL